MFWADRQNNPGFTTMELLVTLLIIGVLAVLAVPSFSHYLSDTRLRSASEGLYSQLSEARAEAIKQQANITVAFQTGSAWCYGATTASTCDCTTASSCNLGQIDATDYSNVTFSISGFSASTVFSGSRGASTNAGTLTFTGSNGDTIYITLDNAGFVKICSATVSGYKAC